jgi:hypothetical protein
MPSTGLLNDAKYENIQDYGEKSLAARVRERHGDRVRYKSLPPRNWLAWIMHTWYDWWERKSWMQEKRGRGEEERNEERKRGKQRRREQRRRDQSNSAEP